MPDISTTLAGLPAFSGLSKADLRKIERLMTPINIKSGKTLMKQGAVGAEAFVIVEGKASVRKGSRVVATVGPGDVIGEMAILSRHPRSATVTAETDMLVEVLSRREFSSLLDEVPSLSKKIMLSVIDRLNELEPNLAS